MIARFTNPCKEANTGYTTVHGFYIAIRFQACYVACHLKASIGSNRFFDDFLLHFNDLWSLNTD